MQSGGEEIRCGPVSKCFHKAHASPNSRPAEASAAVLKRRVSSRQNRPAAPNPIRVQKNAIGKQAQHRSNNCEQTFVQHQHLSQHQNLGSKCVHITDSSPNSRPLRPGLTACHPSAFSNLRCI